MTNGRTAAKPKFKETELYLPLKTWLEERGYTVYAEVCACDVAARLADELVLMELKLSINLDLILQVLKRQEASESVYAVVPAPKNMSSRRWRELKKLLKRLGAGLIIVFLNSPLKRVELLFHPSSGSKATVKKLKQKAIIKEMGGRKKDINIGGSSQQKIMTAYREETLIAANILNELKTASPKELKLKGASPKVGRILLDNHYAWFHRIKRGHYCLSQLGLQALLKHESYLALLKKNE